SPAPALHQPLALEVEKDLFQELVRNTVLPRDVSDHGGGLDTRKRKQCLERVLCPLRNHGLLPASYTRSISSGFLATRFELANKAYDSQGRNFFCGAN